jgi:hypothetical protein
MVRQRVRAGLRSDGAADTAQRVLTGRGQKVRADDSDRRRDRILFPLERMGDFSTRHKQSVEIAKQIRRLPVSHSIRPLGPTHSAFGFERFTPSVAVAIWRASR